MFERDEIARSLTGAWELFLDRPGAMRRFDVSVEGFWRSFRAIVLVIPAYVVTTLAERIITSNAVVTTEDPGDVLFFIDGAIGLALDWITLPIVLALAARPLGIAGRYGAFIIARNWGSVLAVVPFAVVSLLVVLGLAGADIANFLMLAALIVVLRYNFLIARRALDVGTSFAVGIVILDLAISLMISLVLDAMFGF
jgi:hypothetical protein